MSISDLLFIVVVLCMNYVIGKLILMQLSVTLTTKKESYFFSQFLGIIITVTVYAIYKTNFNSIYILVLPLLILLFRYRKGSFNINYFSDYKGLFAQLAASVFLFFLAYYFFYVYMDGAVYGDNQFYASIAYSLQHTGIETTNFDWTLAAKPASPYHFTEAWFTALWSKLFQLNTLKTYYLLYVPIFGSMVFSGALALVEKLSNRLKTNNTIIYIIAILFLLIQNIDIPFFQITQKFFHVGSWFHNFKFSVVYLIFIAVALLLINKQYKQAFIFLLLSVPLYSPLSISVLSGLFIALVSLRLMKEISIRRFFQAITLLVSIPIIYFLFYFLQNKTGSSFEIPNLSIVSVFAKTTKVFIKLFVFGVLPSGLLIFLVYKMYKSSIQRALRSDFNKIAKILLITFSGSIVSIFVFIPLYFFVNHDAFQLLGNFLVPLFTVLFFISIVFFLNVIQQRFFYTALFILFTYFGVLLYQNPSVSFNMVRESYFEPEMDHTYFKYIENEIANNPDKQFAYFRNYEGKHPMELKPFLFVPDNRIIHFRNNYVPISLSALELPESTDMRYGNKSDYAFYRFYLNNKSKDINQLYIDFVNVNNIGYIIVEPDAQLPSVFNDYIVKSIENKINGNEFIILKNDILQQTLPHW